jgi:CHAT domain-containing protein
MNEIVTEIINVSIGELWDKYTILLIKSNQIQNKDKLKSVNLEIELLNKKMQKYNYIDNPMFQELKKINEELWRIEDAIRVKESNKEFDEVFIQLARDVYITNDKRCHCKNKINDFFGSSIQEIKDYVKYE